MQACQLACSSVTSKKQSSDTLSGHRARKPQGGLDKSGLCSVCRTSEVKWRQRPPIWSRNSKRELLVSF